MIATSRGGLESLERLLAQPTVGSASNGVCFLLIDDPALEAPAPLAEWLVRRTELDVRPGQIASELDGDVLYVVPRDVPIVVRNRRLERAASDESEALSPMDRLLVSLADDVGVDSAVLVLSGTAQDGVRGIERIKRAGGLVLVESPQDARCPELPNAALASGAAHRCAPIDQLVRTLSGDEEDAADPAPIDAIATLLRDHFGTDFSHYKTHTVMRRIQRRADLAGVESLDALVELLRTNPDQLGALYRDLLIGVTQFFRDPEAFAALAERIRRELLIRLPDSEEIRIWVAGCATGEEAYSIAMILCEQCALLGRPVRAKILATDLHRASLDVASAGVYGEEHLLHVSVERRGRFFARLSDGHYQVRKSLRNLIVFAAHDVIHDAPFARLHLISCRNLLIHLTPESQRSVLALFHFGLVPRGLLFLGAGERPSALSDELVALDETHKVYTKRRDVRLFTPFRVAPPSHQVSLLPSRSRATDSELLAIYDQLLDRYMPPAFLVSEDRRLIDSFGGAERYLELRGRRPSSSIFDLMGGELRSVATAAVQRALAQDGPVHHSRVLLSRDDRVRGDVRAEAFVSPRTGVRHVLLSIEEPRVELTATAARAGSAGQSLPQSRLELLEADLAHTRETLQATIRELQRSNEELHATNEELQSTNEELHSVNEELHTINAEYHKKIVELHELNSDVQQLFEVTDVGLLFLDGELRIRKFTPPIARVFNIQPRDVGRSLRDFSHRLERNSLIDEIERAISERTPIDEEVCGTDGTPYLMRVLPYPSTDAGDREIDVFGLVPSIVTGVVLTLTEISSLEQARAGLRELSAIVESSGDAIIGKALDGTITSWNEAAERLYGYTAEEAIGQSIRMLALSESDSEIAWFLRAIERGEHVNQVHTTRLRKDGSQVEVSITLSPIHDRRGRICGASSIARDITEFKRAQRELEATSERLRMLLDSTAEAIYGLDLDGICTFCNASCARMLGFDSIDDLIGRYVPALIRLADPDGNPIETEASGLYSALRTGREAHSESELLLRADDTPFAVEYWSHPIERGGAIIGAVVTFLDITDRKQAEQQLLTASRRREQFLAMLSHELRNPLGAVLSATRILQRPDVSASATDRARDVIERQSRHMARLLDDLLDVSRITHGGLLLRKEALDLRAVIQAAVEAMLAQLGEREIELIWHEPSEPLPVHGDAARLQQVVTNLLSNAVRYSPRSSRIMLGATSDEGWVMLSVLDQGEGIAPSMLSEIFDLFVQSDQGLDRANGGLGVGLTLVREIVNLHGGTVSAKSDGIGKGSEFSVRLPRHAEASSVPSLESDEARLELRILVVEDQADAREMLRLLLQASGHVALEASDGRGALERIQADRPDAAVIDIGLPSMSGYEVAKRVREELGMKEILLVALTGYGTDEDVRAARAAGFDEHLTKPTDPEALERILRRHAAARAAARRH